MFQKPKCEMFSAISYYIFGSESGGDSDGEEPLRVERRKLRDNTNVLELPDAEFKQNFRVNKDVFRYLFAAIKPHFKETYRNTHLPPHLKLATFLRFLATGSYQKSIGIEFVSSMSESTVCKVIAECLTIFETHLCQKWVKLSRTVDEENSVKEYFYSKFGIPGIVGCVDGTHVRIKSPGERRQHLYYNRKDFYSLNAMAICDHNMVIRYVDARHPGCNHDAFVWQHSAAEQQFRLDFNNGKTNTWLLGDSGYRLEPYMMTPFRNPSGDSEIRFNEIHCKARNIIERCFGVLKNRFRCIIGSRGLHYSAEKTTKIINVCCALHNVCIFYKNDWPPLDTTSDENNTYDNEENISNNDISTGAEEIRRQLALSLV